MKRQHLHRKRRVQQARRLFLLPHRHGLLAQTRMFNVNNNSLEQRQDAVLGNYQRGKPRQGVKCVAIYIMNQI